MKHLIACMCLILILSLPVCAEENQSQNDVSDAIDSYYSSLPSEILSALPVSLKDELKNGEGAPSVDGAFAVRLVLKCVSRCLGDVAPFITALALTVMLTSVISSLGDGITDKPLSTVGAVAVASVSVTAIVPLVKEVKTAMTLMGAVVKGIIPAVSLVGASSAQPSLTAVNASWLSILLALITKLNEEILAPAVTLCLAFSVSGALNRGGAMAISGLGAVVKRCIVFVTTLISTALTVIMSFQTVLAKSSDTVLLRSLRFAAGSVVPVVGGTVSEVAGGYLSGISAVRGALGTVCAVSVVICSVPIIVKLFAFKIGMGAVALLAQAMGCDAYTDIKEIGSVTDLLSAITVLTAVTLTISVGVFAAVSVS